jgi:hypothetical protein
MFCNRAADPAAGAGDDGDFSFKRFRHFRLLSLSGHLELMEYLSGVIADNRIQNLTLVKQMKQYWAMVSLRT